MKTIVVLGAAVWAAGPSPTLRRRCDHAARLWHSGRYDYVVVCGGLGRFAPIEAVAMCQLLVNAGIPQNAIHQEDQSTNTFENLSFAAPILTKLGSVKVTIVTDHYHRPRAWMVARAMGLDAQTSSPSLAGTHIATQVRQYLRECLALPAYAIKLVLRKR